MPFLWHWELNPPKRNFTHKCNNCEEFKNLFLKLKEHEEQCYELRQQINFVRQHRQHQINQIKSLDTKLKTGIAEGLREPLMRIAQQLLISDKNTFEQLTPTEKQLWTAFKTADIYRFLTGEEDTVPEFQYNWTTVPRLQPLDPTNTSFTPASTAPPAAPPAPGLPPVSPPSSAPSTSTAPSSPHSSPTPSTSGTRPKQTPLPRAQPSQPDPSGASTWGTTPQPPATKAHNLRQRSKVDYKDLNTGASQFGRSEFRKWCSRAGASVSKSVA